LAGIVIVGLMGSQNSDAIKQSQVKNRPARTETIFRSDILANIQIPFNIALKSASVWQTQRSSGTQADMDAEGDGRRRP
jgi:hypothetical protein